MLESDVLIQNIIEIGESAPERVFAKLLFQQSETVTVSYLGLLTNGAKYATLYKENGVEKGEVIVLILNHSEELIYSFVGALLYGAIPSIFAHPSIKISAQEYATTLRRLLGACHTRFVLTDDEISEQLSNVNTSVKKVRILTANAYVKYPRSREKPSCKESDTVLLQHSSGTTGLKKGVALSNRSVINQLRNYALTLWLRDDDKIASWLPLYHDMGLIAGFILPMTCGVPLVLMSPFDWIANPAILLRAIHEEGSTLCWMPNFAYNFLATRVDVEKSNGLDLSSVRAFINCAEPISARSHQLFYHRFRENGLRAEALCTCYAMAENTFAVTQGGIGEVVQVETLDAEALRNRKEAVLATATSMACQTVVSSGKPIPKNYVRIVDDEGQDLPDRSVGEIIIHSDSMLSEYYHRPDITEQAIKNGWYFTGDLGYVSKKHLFVIGRKKDMIIVAGKNVYPQDIEDTASSIEGVRPGRVAAFGVYDEKIGTEEIIILAETQVEDYAKQLPIKLAIACAVREQFDCVANNVILLPPMWLLKSSSGKISRAANRDKYLRQLKTQDGLVQNTKA